MSEKDERENLETGNSLTESGSAHEHDINKSYDVYDVAIIGAGPAGLSAALYSSRYKLKTLMLGRKFGGWMSFAPKVENYPGIKAVSGAELTKKFKEHIEGLPIARVSEDAVEIKKERDKENSQNTLFRIKATNDKEYLSRTVIIATGTEKRKLNMKGEEKFLGRGVSYCVTCDAALFAGKNVAVVGGGNSAAVAALLLAEYAKSVKIIYRGDKLRAAPVLLSQIEENPKISVIYNAIPIQANGDSFLESIIINKVAKDKSDKEDRKEKDAESSKEESESMKELKVEGLFIEIGSVPLKVAAKDMQIEYDDKGYIITDKNQASSVQGIFAAGDVTDNSLKQIITAAAEGAVAAHSAFKFCLETKRKEKENKKQKTEG